MTATDLYLDLMKRILINTIYPEGPSLAANGATEPRDPKRREVGRDWPHYAHTMIGRVRLDNIQFCVEDILKHNIPGDLIETGVWRGGATIFMRAILKAHNISNRRVWVADSFQGLPVPNLRKYRSDRTSKFHKVPELAVSLEEVQENFTRYGLLDDQVHFLKGWFKETLHQAPITQLAVMRLDGDMYESTMDALYNLYPKLSINGYVIIDDFCLQPCRQAVHDYRAKHDIQDEIIKIDWTGVYWKRTK